MTGYDSSLTLLSSIFLIIVSILSLSGCCCLFRGWYLIDRSGLRKHWLGDIITLEHMFLEKVVMRLPRCDGLFLIETDWLLTIIRGFNGVVKALSSFQIRWCGYLRSPCNWKPVIFFPLSWEISLRFALLGANGMERLILRFPQYWLYFLFSTSNRRVVW
jgi:hypothetical protein